MEKLAFLIEREFLEFTGGIGLVDAPVVLFCPEGIEIHLLIAAILAIGAA